MLHIVLAATLAMASEQGAPQGPSRAGWEAIQRGEGDKAAAIFRDAVAANPRNADALAGAGVDAAAVAAYPLTAPKVFALLQTASR